jgi:site-specific DNA-methyltransferase (adenine-specific)
MSQQPTPYYADDHVTIYHGDCEDVLPSLSADLCVTSPPYNMGLTPGGGGRGMYQPSASRKGGRFRGGYDGGCDDAMPWADYDAWQRQIIDLILSRCRLGLFYNHRPRVIHGNLRLPLNGDYSGLPLRQIIIWDRGTGIDVNLRHFCTAHEYVMLFAHPSMQLVDHAASGMSDVWRLGMAPKSDHPAPFPISLAVRAISSVADANVIIDPFAGSGTTLRAAKDLGRRAIGIEKSERYCEIAAERLAQEVFDFGGVA